MGSEPRPPVRIALEWMRLIVARCAAQYSGRLDTVLPEALRLIMVKSDGSVLLHADSGGYKPLNCS
jgi:endonuclease